MSLFSSHKKTVVGIDITDTTLRILQLHRVGDALVPSMWREIALPVGCIASGVITDARALTAILASLRKQYKLRNVHIGLPASLVTLVTVPVQKDTPNLTQSVRAHITKRGIDPKQHVIEYRVVAATETDAVIQAHALPESVAKDYVRVCMLAGLTATASILDGQAQARALLTPNTQTTNLIVSIGSTLTTMTIVAHGVAMQTTTVPTGGRALVDIYMNELGIDEATARKRLLDDGLLQIPTPLFELLTDSIGLLKDEIRRVYVRWHEKKGTYGIEHPVDHIVLAGEYGAIGGLDDYLSASLRTKVVVGNPWSQCLSFDAVIPMLPHDDALGYTTAIGLALDDGTHLNLIPSIQKRYLQKRRAMHRTVAIIVVCIIAIVAAFLVSTVFSGDIHKMLTK